ncbi:MAG: ankyrin repeat domain-containing protein, partial [Planctomycetia bacterium]
MSAGHTRSSGRDDLPEVHRLIRDEGLESLVRWFQPTADLDAPAPHGTTPLMTAIAMKDLGKVEWLLLHGADPEKTDDFSKTALAVAVDRDFLPAIELLIRAGVDRGYEPKYPPKPLVRLFPDPDGLTMPEELRSVMPEAEWREMMRAGFEAFAANEVNVPVQPLIGDVASFEALRLFLAAGDRLQDAPRELRRRLLGLPEEAEFSVSQEEFLRDWKPRWGETNPQRIESAFLRDMVLTGRTAWAARAFFTSGTDSSRSPVWCDSRFGASLTELPDGRHVQIGGEHEDHYDVDFQIYNDLIVFDGRGGFEIFGYPQEDFPPTDFHSATLVDDQIYVIGGLGYRERREFGTTPVFRFDTATWKVSRVANRKTGGVPNTRRSRKPSPPITSIWSSTSVAVW